MTSTEERIRKIINLYYSRPDIQGALFNFSKNREIAPRYFEGFGTRPDTFQYENDIFELVKKGATSFHCSEELWFDPLNLQTGMTVKQLDELRIGWDLLIDIDCKWFDYAKLAVQSVIKSLEQHNVKNMGIKFSGSKGFHVIIPWKSFPKEINGIQTKNLFPELPRKLIAYLRFYSEKVLKESLPEDFYKQFKDAKIKRGIKCKTCNEVADIYDLIELYCPFCKISEERKVEKNFSQKVFCPECKREYEKKDLTEFYECQRCLINSKKQPDNFSKSISIDLYDLIGLDIILVSPRHLFRMPYSLHEKTALASVVLEKSEIAGFELKHANPLKAKVREFIPDSREDEAKEFVVQALDWAKDNLKEKSFKATGKYADYKPIKLDSIKQENFPPCIKNILKGISDGKKRALFALINLFRSIGMEKEDLEKQIAEWNKKNEPPIKQGYIQTQIAWAYKHKSILPPNCKEFYQGFGVCQPDNFCRIIKNPANYVIRKSLKKDKE